MGPELSQLLASAPEVQGSSKGLTSSLKEPCIQIYPCTSVLKVERKVALNKIGKEEKAVFCESENFVF